MRSVLLLILALWVICILMPADCAEWYVDDSASVSGDGTSWEAAFQSIQEGIDAASDGDTVTVAEGLYVENIHFQGKNIVLTSTEPLNSDVVANTIIDGNQAGSVVTFSGAEVKICVLSGFTVRNGKAEHGGGIMSEKHWEVVWTTAKIQNNIITGNSGGPAGGLYHCNGEIKDNVITGNSGGGLHSCNGVIERNVISSNSAQGSGGGLEWCNGTIQHNTIAGNSATQYGGGLAYCHGIIQNNTISGNSAQLSGGGLYSCNGSIRDNIISGNSAGGDGGGLEECNGTIQNNVIVGNSAGDEGGGLDRCWGMIDNCIIWGNTATPSVTGTVWAQVMTCPAINYSCIQDWTPGPQGATPNGKGNIADDPRFADPDGLDNDPLTYEDNDYRLATGSPCIDAGLNEDWMWEAVDLGGNSRIFPGDLLWRVDMGAYEYVPVTYTFSQLPRQTAAGFQIVWTSEPGRAYAIVSCVDLLTGLWADEETVLCQGVTTRWTAIRPPGRMKFYRIEIE